MRFPKCGYGFCTSEDFENNSQREFYTVGYNGIPDQTSFAKWCFKTPPTCKERGLNCGPYTGSLI